MSMLMRSAAMRRANANTNQGFLRGASTNQEAPKKRKGLDALDGAEDAGMIAKVFKFKVHCCITARNNMHPTFVAQLNGKQSFFVCPLMPHDPYGNELTPERVANGAEGYLVMAVSENAEFEEDANGQNTLTVRPEFWSFPETYAEALKDAEALKAELARRAEEARKALEPAKK